jgi:hypothetical protein
MALPKITNPDQSPPRELYVTRWEFRTPHGGQWTARIHVVPYDYDTDTVAPYSQRMIVLDDLRGLAEQHTDIATAMGALMVALDKYLQAQAQTEA